MLLAGALTVSAIGIQLLAVAVYILPILVVRRGVAWRSVWGVGLEAGFDEAIDKRIFAACKLGLLCVVVPLS